MCCRFGPRRKPSVPVTPSALPAALSACAADSFVMCAGSHCDKVSAGESIARPGVLSSRASPLLKEAPRGQEQIPALSNEFALGTQRAEIDGCNGPLFFFFLHNVATK